MLQKIKGAALSALENPLVVGTGALFVAGSSMAQTTFDVTDVTGTITAVVAAAAVIGAAALAMHYGIRAWKWLRGAG
jgi:hypothetical protein